nr:short-chain dehydrogenase [Acidobacteriota bacterium]
LTAYLQGLRNRLSPSGVRVITIKPGFVDTRMTFGRPAMFLVASPEAAARHIVTAIERGKDVTYVPGFWRPVMIAIRAIPEKIFKRMNL